MCHHQLLSLPPSDSHLLRAKKSQFQDFTPRHLLQTPLNPYSCTSRGTRDQHKLFSPSITRNGERHLEKYSPPLLKAFFLWIKATKAVGIRSRWYFGMLLSKGSHSCSFQLVIAHPLIIPTDTEIVPLVDSLSLRSACSTWKAADHTLKHRF